MADKFLNLSLAELRETVAGQLAAPPPARIKQSVELPLLPWKSLRYHEKQRQFLFSERRFNIVPAGRRSGKTEITKRRAIMKALMTTYDDARVILAAPTYNQAKRIFWKDLKKMVPRHLRVGKPSESDLSIYLVNGCTISVMGMDSPERVEGSPLTHIGLDEYANMKPEAWTENVRPALSDHLGTADFTGVPEGRNHYYEMWNDALIDTSGNWGAFTWESADILPPEEVLAAQNQLDELTFNQEYKASFVTFSGRIYYNFNLEVHAVKFIPYNPDGVLILCFDFNTSPGVAVICQEIAVGNETVTGCIGEVHIPRDSNTVRVCDKLIYDWKEHRGRVKLYGDATGGAGGTAKVEGSDWEIIKKKLKPVFGDRLQFCVPDSNPRERQRVNSMNSRIMSTSGQIRLRVSREKCPQLIKCLEGTRVLEGSAGEIDKHGTPEITHLSDALGYYVDREFPVRERIVTTRQL